LCGNTRITCEPYDFEWNRSPSTISLIIERRPSIGGMEVTPSGLLFYLGTKHTACLAPEKCGVGDAGCC